MPSPRSSIFLHEDFLPPADHVPGIEMACQQFYSKGHGQHHEARAPITFAATRPRVRATPTEVPGPHARCP
jgi:hypothetical protein